MHFPLLLTAAHAVAPEPGLALAVEQAAPPVRTLTAHQYVRATASSQGRKVGLVLKNSVVALAARETVQGRGCASGWLRLEERGFVCSKWTTETEAGARPVPLPQLVAFDHPDPGEYFSYLESGTYPRQAVGPRDALVPFVYGKAWRRWRAPVWTSLWAWEHGRPAETTLETDRKFAFVQAIETKRGTVFRRANGTVVPAETVFLYPITDFMGRDLVEAPPKQGFLAGWVTDYDGATVFDAAGADANAVGSLSFQSEVEVWPEPAAPGWVRIRGAGDVDTPRFVARAQVTVASQTLRPPEVEDTQLWVDIDLEAQVLFVLQGDTALFATLVSTGREDKRRGTPTGLYQSYDKAAWGDMTSREGANDAYHVEKVPWIMHFWPRYALHGTFWHWGFGHQASHGCVNLSPRDAAWIFQRIGPTLPAGWHTAYAREDNPGTVIRIRKGQEPVTQDRRTLPGRRTASRSTTAPEQGR